MNKETIDIIKIILAMFMFLVALSLAIYLFIKIKKKTNMTITTKKWTLTGTAVTNIYRLLIFFGIMLIRCV